MTPTVSLFILVLGMVLLLLAGFNIPSNREGQPPRVNFGWLGLFLCYLSALLK